MFDLWRRWHITLSRLARDLVYVPLSRGHSGTLRRSANLMLTMLLIGVWHGAGWTFVAWGAFNGVLLLINQAWRSLWNNRKATPLGRFFGWALTLTAFSAGSVFFRAIDIESSWHLMKAMGGFGTALGTEAITLNRDDWLIRHGYLSDAFVRTWFGTTWTMVGTLWTLAVLAIALLLPDTMEITDYREGDAQSDWRGPVWILAWRPTPVMLALTAGLFVAVFVNIGRVSEFLYYQF